MDQIFLIIYKGILLGLFLAILVGPLLAALVQAGIEGGKKAGFQVALGIWISDLLILMGMYLSRNFLTEILNQSFIYVFGICGAIILFFIAWKNLKADQQQLHKKKLKSNTLLLGFLINTINPFTFFFWSGVILYYNINEGYSDKQILLLLLSIFSVIIITDSLKVFFASFLQKQLKSGALIYVQKTSGIVFLIFGIVLLYRIFFTEIEISF